MGMYPCFFKYCVPENHLPQESHLQSLCLSILFVWKCFLRKNLDKFVDINHSHKFFFEFQHKLFLKIRKKLLQIYCYQNFCSNALTVTLFKSYLSNSNFVKKLLKSYCSNPKV